MKFGIFSRSTAGYLIVLTLLGASNVFAILKLVEFNTVLIRDLDTDIRTLDLEHKLEDAIFSERRNEQKYLLTKDRVLYDQFLSSRAEFNRYLSELNSSPLSPGIVVYLEKIRRYHKRYHELVETEVKYRGEDRKYDSHGFYDEKENLLDDILEALERMEAKSRDDFYYKTTRISQAGASARGVAVSSFLISMLIAILLSFFITRSITRPLIRLVHQTREIPAGTYNCDLNVSSPPEIAELAEAFNIMCERLREVEKVKGDFFSMISHELKTPLTTIREGSSLLLEGAGGEITEKQGRLLTIIAAESRRLTGLVNSILDLSKMEAGMATYNFVKGRIDPLVDQAMTEILPYAEAKKIHLEKEVHPDISPCPMDRERILEVLRNLIGNAVKSTREGGRITIAAVPAGGGGVEVSVSDTGSGIPAAKLAAIFEKYESADKKRGTGLGLAIVKHIVAAHGGKVWVESEVGRGSRFIFSLPS